MSHFKSFFVVTAKSVKQIERKHRTRKWNVCVVKVCDKHFFYKFDTDQFALHGTHKILYAPIGEKKLVLNTVICVERT